MSISNTEFIALILNIITYAGIVQGFSSAFVLTHTKLRNPANQFLAILMVVLSISILHSSFIIPYFHQFHHTNFQIKEPFILLIIPFVWLYVKKLNEPQFRFSKKHLLHFVPFVMVMIVSIVFLKHNKAVASDTQYNTHTLTLNILMYIVALGQYIFYLIYILQIIRSFKAKALNELSNTENIDPTWLRIFLFTFLIIFVLLIAMMIIAIHRLEAGYFNRVVSFIFALAIYILGYKGLFQQTILPQKQEILPYGSEKTEKETIENRFDEQLLKKLLDFMTNHKPYHEPELTLTSLAAQIDIGRNQLSELINTGTGGNFYDFVNKYRVEEVKQLMDNLKYKDYTILAIAFEAGFPSKSTFNSIFKKFTGLTPSGYRNSL
ncbi:MAG: AraC family transcriptional regulator [Bacteroidales bacterium]|nr:AraC family transcriptional regulator [Bacteroidales bacterium]